MGLFGGEKPAEKGLLDVLKDWSAVSQKLYNAPIVGLPVRTAGAVATTPQLSSTLTNLLLKKLGYNPQEAYY
jgi:hypothetical protein